MRNKYEEPEAIIVFGSYSRGEDQSGSDIDIAIITKKRINVSTVEFEKRLKRKINIYEIQIKHAEKEFLNTLANGIVLYGHMRVVG
ncbi:MAG: nucleotidyltransferase domain-containing protein [Candidatus Aenigmarchaeota archaeon]|nr:nucleotidyltransferase domain-containing protein [Candidatus Aenigmarchaeota archaeon]